MNPFQPFQMNMQGNNQIIEEIIQPFKEKIKKLEDALMEKDIEIAKLKYTISQMNQMGMYNQFNPMNMNPMQNNPMINPMFPMDIQMNMSGNMMTPPISKETKKKKKIKNLKLKFKLENDIIICVQCRSNEKIEEPIKKFCIKSGYKMEEFKFIVNGKKVKMNLTVDKNGINSENQYILVEKKNENDYIEEKNEKNVMEENNDDSDYEYEDEDNNNEICNDIIDNVKILGEKIFLGICFQGKTVTIEIGTNNNFNDVIIKFCAKNKIPISKVKRDYAFLYNSRKIGDREYMKTLKEMGFRNGTRMDAIDGSSIIGA